MGLSGAMHTLLTLLRDPWRSNHSKLGMLGLEMMFHARRVLHVTDILVSLNERGPASQVRLPARETSKNPLTAPHRLGHRASPVSFPK